MSQLISDDKPAAEDDGDDNQNQNQEEEAYDMRKQLWNEGLTATLRELRDKF